MSHIEDAGGASVLEMVELQTKGENDFDAENLHIVEKSNDSVQTESSFVMEKESSCCMRFLREWLATDFLDETTVVSHLSNIFFGIVFSYLVYTTAVQIAMAISKKNESEVMPGASNPFSGEAEYPSKWGGIIFITSYFGVILAMAPIVGCASMGNSVYARKAGRWISSIIVALFTIVFVSTFAATIVDKEWDHFFIQSFSVLLIAVTIYHCYFISIHTQIKSEQREEHIRFYPRDDPNNDLIAEFWEEPQNGVNDEPEPHYIWSTMSPLARSDNCTEWVRIPSRIWIAIFLVVLFEFEFFFHIYKDYWGENLKVEIKRWTQYEYPVNIDITALVKFISPYFWSIKIPFHQADDLVKTYMNDPNELVKQVQAVLIEMFDPVITEAYEENQENFYDIFKGMLVWDKYHLFLDRDVRDAAMGFRIAYIFHNFLILYSCLNLVLSYRKVYIGIIRENRPVPQNVYPIGGTIRFIGSFVFNTLFGASLLSLNIAIVVVPIVLTRFWEKDEWYITFFQNYGVLLLYAFFHVVFVRKLLVGRLLGHDGLMPESEWKTTVFRALVLLLEMFYFPLTVFLALIRLLLLYMLYSVSFFRLEASVMPHDLRRWDDAHVAFITLPKIAAYRYFEEKRKEAGMKFRLSSIASEQEQQGGDEFIVEIGSE